MEFTKGQWIKSGKGHFLKFSYLKNYGGYNRIYGTEYKDPSNLEMINSKSFWGK